MSDTPSVPRALTDGDWRKKNIVETKHARRLLIEGPAIEAAWRGEADALGLVLKSETELNTPWTVRRDD
jgi:hypothetical protein